MTTFEHPFPPSALVEALNARADERWVEVADRVRSQAMRATRRSAPVHAQAPSGTVHISEQVVISYVRDAVAPVIPGEVDDIDIALEGRDTFTGVTISISARYGVRLIEVADAVREQATARLRELLGDVAPAVTMRTITVHVDDVVPPG